LNRRRRDCKFGEMADRKVEDAPDGSARSGIYLPDGKLRGMFERIGATYDVQNHILSLGRDIQWRRFLADALWMDRGGLVLDMGTGTGDTAIAIARRWPRARVVGFDYSRRMLSRAREKARRLPAGVAERISLFQGDLRRSGLPDSHADVLTSTFVIRNIPERAQVLAEFRRLLVRGGRLFIMEPGVPVRGAAGAIYRAYLDHVLPCAGNVLSRTNYAYSLLRRSIRGFPAPEDFLRELKAAGFSRARATPLSYGIAVLYRAVKE
jgi:demethylmenaquinone methyltransferase/2-methoxy-6-polyprenyl-1,4-benzoquinol methylase